MVYNSQPDDSSNVPISSVYAKESNAFPALQAEPGAYYDSFTNQSSAAVVSFLRPLIVQKAHAVTGSGGKTLNCAFTNNNIAGNSIVVCMGMGEVEGAGITLTITDTNSNFYSESIKATQSTTLESAIFLSTGPATGGGIAAGANTVTVTIAGGSSSNTAIAVEIYEVWGIITLAGALDQTATGNNAGSTSPATSAVSPLAPNELAFAALSAAGGTITAGTGWNLDSGTLSPTGGNLVSFGAESQALTGIASITGSASLSGSNAWAIALATFRTVSVPIIGTVNQGGAPWQENITQFGGNAVVTGTGAGGAGVPRVTLSNDSSLANNQSVNVSQFGGNNVVTGTGAGGSGVPRVTVSNDSQTSNIVSSTNGSIPYHNVSAASTNATNVKGSGCKLYSYSISNTSGASEYVKFYDKATAPTIGTDTPKFTIEIPATGANNQTFPEGVQFSNGFGWGTTTGAADGNTTAVASGDLVVDFRLNS